MSFCRDARLPMPSVISRSRLMVSNCAICAGAGGNMPSAAGVPGARQQTVQEQHARAPCTRPQSRRAPSARASQTRATCTPAAPGGPVSGAPAQQGPWPATIRAAAARTQAAGGAAARLARLLRDAQVEQGALALVHLRAQLLVGQPPQVARLGRLGHRQHSHALPRGRGREPCALRQARRAAAAEAALRARQGGARVQQHPAVACSTALLARTVGKRLSSNLASQVEAAGQATLDFRMERRRRGSCRIPSQGPGP